MEFKRCTKCGAEWDSRDVFLTDPCVRLDGYQVNFTELEAGLFLFSHRAKSCGTTLAIRADQFTDLHDGPIFRKSLRRTPECLGLCGRSEALDACPAQCECAFVRDVLQKVLKWPKKAKCASPEQVAGRRQQ